MCELSTADGFVEINENLGDMIKYVANEPSVGLYYIQQHAHNAVPNVVRLKNNVMEKSREVSLQTEDLDDSIAMTRTMKECGFPIIDEMIRDIKSSLTVISSKQPVRGLIQQRHSSYQLGAPSSWAPVTWARGAVSIQDDGERPENYFSSVFKSAREKTGNLKWSQSDLKEVKENMAGDLSIYRDQKVLPSASNSSTQPDKADELPVSSQVENKTVQESNVSTDGKTEPLLSADDDFDEFKADREARLEEWLEGSGSVLQKGIGGEEGHHQLKTL